MTTELVLCPAASHHHPALLHVWEQAVRATHHFLTPGDIAFFRHTILEQDLFSQVCITMALYTDGAIAGFAGTSGSQLEMLFVHPHHFRKGIGKRLLDHALSNEGINLVDVNEQNPGAVAFYEAMGFATVSRSPFDASGKPFPILHMKYSGITPTTPNQ